MGQYIARRLLASIPVLLGVTLVAFFLMRLIPGDVAMSMLREEYTPEQGAAIRHFLGLDRPLPLQVVDWVWRVARLDFGKSFVTGRSIMGDVLARFPATLELATAAVLLAAIVGFPLGILAATRRGSMLDLIAQFAGLLGLTMPSFWLGLLLILVVSLYLRLLPSGGFVSLAESPARNLRLLVLPACTLALPLAAVIMRYVRSSLLDVLQQDYVRTARSKGLGERVVLWRHMMRNALIPVVTIMGIQFGNLLAGTVVVEAIFAWPGIGRMTLSAIYARDYPVVQTMIILMAGVFVIMNLVIDITYSLLDPRIRLR